MTVLLGSTSFLVFRVASFRSDGETESDLTSFMATFTPASISGPQQTGYDTLYHTHPNGIVLYFQIVQAEDEGEYRLTHSSESWLIEVIETIVHNNVDKPQLAQHN